MDCPNCQNELPADVSECPKCGVPIGGRVVVKQVVKKPDSKGLQRQLRSLLDHADTDLMAKRVSSCRSGIESVRQMLADNQPAEGQDPPPGYVESGNRMASLEEKLTPFEERLGFFAKEAKKALAERDYRACCDAFEKAAAVTVEETGCAEAYQQASAALDTIRDALADARAAKDAEDWPAVKQACDEVLELRPGHTEAKHLLDDANKVLHKGKKTQKQLLVFGLVAALALIVLGLVVFQVLGRQAKGGEYEAHMRDGYEQLEKNDWDAARLAFERARAVPGHEDEEEAGNGVKSAQAGVLTDRAATAQEKGDWQEVKRLVDDAERLDAGASAVVEFRQLLSERKVAVNVRRLLADKNYDGAKSRLDSLGRDPLLEDVKTLREQAEKGIAFLAAIENGKGFLAEKSWDKADAAFANALASGLDDKLARIWQGRARSHRLLATAATKAKDEDWAAALKLADEADALSPGYKPVRDFRKQMVPEAVAAYVKDAEAKVDEKDYPVALKTIDMVLKLEPGNASAKSVAATCKSRIAEYEDALQKGDDALDERQLKRAASFYTRAKEIYPKGEAGDRLKKLGGKQGKVSALLKKAAVALEKRDIDTAGMLAEQVLRDHDPKSTRAKRILKEAFELAKKADGLHVKAKAERNKGDLTQAVMLLKQVLKFNRSHLESKELLKQIEADRTRAQTLMAGAKADLRAAQRAGGKPAKKSYEAALGKAREALVILRESGEAENIIRQSMPRVTPDGLVAITIFESTIGVGETMRPKLKKIFGDQALIGPDEIPEYRARLRPYWIGKHEVTNQEFSTFLNDRDAAESKKVRDRLVAGKLKQVNIRLANGKYVPAMGEAKKPVVSVTWEDASAYCQWYGRQLGYEGNLPTEAQWETAAAYDGKGGKRSAFPWGDDIATAKEVSRGSVGRMLVGSVEKDVSKSGLYDMGGNVHEWCRDWYDVGYYNACRRAQPVLDPAGARNGTFRSVRGSAVRLKAEYQSYRVTARTSIDPNEARMDVGFRVVVELPGIARK